MYPGGRILAIALFYFQFKQDMPMLTDTRHRIRKWLPQIVALTALVLVTLTGCSKGPKLVNVQGVVNVDGQATQGINLLFFKQGQAVAGASGVSGAGGAITTTTNGEPGIELGKYDVVAIYPDPQFKAPPAGFGQSPPDPPDLFKGKYFKSKVPVDIDSAGAKVSIELSLK